MKLWNPLALFRRETKASQAAPLHAMSMIGQPAWTPRNYESLSRESYMMNAVAFRCVKMIASGAASIDWLLHDGQGNEIDNHPLLDLLHRPGPMIGGQQLFEAVYAYLLLSGNSYVEAVAANDGVPRELWALRPDRMKVVPGDSGLPAGYVYEVHGRKFRWDVDQLRGQSPILHLREFHPLDDWYGLSRVETAAYSVDRHNAASRYNKALLDNGARPSGALVFQPITSAGSDPQLPPHEVIQAAEVQLMQRHGGPENAGRPMVFGGSVKWEEMATSPKDMDFGGSKLDAARDICNAFGVPHILIVPGESTYNNVREAKLELYEEVILPITNLLVDQLNAWLAPAFSDGLKLSLDLDSVSALEPRRESKRKTVVELLSSGVLEPDEAREALQYGPRPDGAVRKADPQLITALLSATETVGIGPLARYLRAVRLIEDGVSDEQVLAAALALIEGDDETDPPPDEDGENDDQS